MFDDVPIELTQGIASMPERFLPQAHVVAAGLVCAYYLGPAFVEKMRSPFFEAMPDSEGNVSFRFGQRVLGVGETLFLLRKQPGFAEYTMRFRRDDLRATFFECMVARLFRRAGFTLSSKARSGVRGQDFDIQASRGSDIVNVEVTALVDKPFSARTLSNTIQSKRDQLPDDAPAAMFVIYPTSWWFEQRSNQFKSVARSVFGRTRRLNALVFLGELMPELEPGSGTTLFHVTSIFHDNPRHQSDALSFLPGRVRQEQSDLSVDYQLVTKMDSDFLDWVAYALSTRKVGG